MPTPGPGSMSLDLVCRQSALLVVCTSIRLHVAQLSEKRGQARRSTKYVDDDHVSTAVPAQSGGTGTLSRASGLPSGPFSHDNGISPDCRAGCPKRGAAVPTPSDASAVGRGTGYRNPEYVCP
ncbi:uncharacterized protein LY79DRAFT_540823 [Colletotrichum navitas]|uniref:Uncharacterized protein n=1 Tax=Colletotrichum navitas TaxID=681940 RepID=A0AAD8Q9X6_9PEZI|nr:uncharacterized protein LY79DRAFT_540823 [Colletotrichum navitas]KAK1597702.1 hypothetical protein LY79DRAFT_540823 [Colletotrichum navitas]